tara:strand:+ start:3086 stop:4066 length:981 start_codon:yes stop_codon:yes gene_type:complete
MTLGLGYSLIDDSFFNEFTNNFAMDFDGTDDYALVGISGQDPANGTIKPVSPDGFTVAAWVRLDVDSDSYNTTTRREIIDCAQANGGYNVYYQTRRIYFKVNLIDGDDNLVGLLLNTYPNIMRAPTSASDYNKYLHKSDNWHFVVGTWDGVNTAQLYVDGDRSQAGAGGQDGSSGVTQFGSEPETSESKKVATSPSGGAYTMTYTTTNDLDEMDIVIGATASYNNSTDVTIGNTNFWQGQIGDIGIWEVELSQAEIKALYNRHVPTDMSGTQADNLQGYWKSEEGSGTTVSEETGNVGTNMTLVNGVDNTSTAAPSTDVTGYYGYR